MKVVGFDPGLSGGVAYLEDSGKFGIFAMPLKTDQFGKRSVDSVKIARFLTTIKPDYVCIEQLGMYGNKSGLSVAISGQNWGRIVGLVEAMQIRCFVADAKKWQRELGVKHGDEDIKVRIHRRMLELFPHADFSRKSNRKAKYDFDDGKVDALAIAQIGLWQALGFRDALTALNPVVSSPRK